MRDPIVIAKFHHLRIDKYHLHLFRPCFVEYAGNDGVDADRFTRTGRTCNQKMRHLAQIGNHRIAADITSYREGKFALAVFEC